jgi:hypothetical protein
MVYSHPNLIKLKTYSQAFADRDFFGKLLLFTLKVCEICGIIRSERHGFIFIPILPSGYIFSNSDGVT